MANKVITDFDEKTAPVVADMALISDSAATNAYKKVQLGNLPITSVLQSLSLQNEVMNFPANVGIDIDLDAANQWWDKVGTPTAAVFMTDIAGESGITETYEYALETTADASGEGFSQRYTYADQPRIKSGLALSAIAAVWVGTAGRTVTMELTTSASTTVTATATAQAWTVIKCENLTLDGTYVDLKFTVDGADTFYVVPLGVNLGTKALRLPPRGLRRVQMPTTVIVLTLTGKGDEATWTDIDLTSNTSALAAVAEANFYLYDPADVFVINVRANGSTDTANRLAVTLNPAQVQLNSVLIATDDAQIFEYYLDRAAGTGTLGEGDIQVSAYWEWE